MLASPLMTRVCVRPFNAANYVCRRKLSLAYTKHCVAQSSIEEGEYAPLIVLHGLFGSRQNNRSISKYDINMIRW